MYICTHIGIYIYVYIYIYIYIINNNNNHNTNDNTRGSALRGHGSNHPCDVIIVLTLNITNIITIIIIITIMSITIINHIALTPFVSRRIAARMRFMIPRDTVSTYNYKYT